MTNDNYSPDELYHYGILGMRWGIRRTPEELGHEILKNEHKQAETAAKIAKIERKHASNPNMPYRKSEARVYKRAAKLQTERADLENELEVANKYKAVQESKAQLKKEQQEAKAAKQAQKKAQYEAKKAEKEAKERMKQNSHYLQNKPVAEMTDRELVDYLNRKANEQRYAQLNPKKRSVKDDIADFAKKNTGKAVQALIDTGLDLGKEAFKNEIHKEWEKKNQTNSREKFFSKPFTELNDNDLKKALDRAKNERNFMNALSSKNSGKSSFDWDGMSDAEKEQFAENIYEILEGLGRLPS